MKDISSAFKVNIGEFTGMCINNPSQWYFKEKAY